MTEKGQGAVWTLATDWLDGRSALRARVLALDATSTSSGARTGVVR